jgi:hypothetical protein
LHCALRCRRRIAGGASFGSATRFALARTFSSQSLSCALQPPPAAVQQRRLAGTPTAASTFGHRGVGLGLDGAALGAHRLATGRLRDRSGTVTQLALTGDRSQDACWRR